MLRILGPLFAGLLGLAFGSFLNVCLSRWPRGESIVTPRSHCRACNRTLAWWENIPVISWLALRGRCRSCGASIAIRYPLVEIFIGVAWAVLAWQRNPAYFFAPREYAVAMAIFCFVLVGLATLDAEFFWLPDSITLPMIAAGAAWNAFLIWQMSHIFMAKSPWLPDASPWVVAVGLYLLGILSAAALILLIRWLYKALRHREGLGLGDAKLMALLAAWLGLPLALLSFALGVFLGALVALAVLAVPARRRTDETWGLIKLPLGTFLCIGGIVSALWGQPILAAYLHLAGF